MLVSRGRGRPTSCLLFSLGGKQRGSHLLRVGCKELGFCLCLTVRGPSSSRGVSTDHMENLGFHAYLAATRCPSTSLLGWCQRRFSGDDQSQAVPFCAPCGGHRQSGSHEACSPSMVHSSWQCSEPTSRVAQTSTAMKQ